MANIKTGITFRPEIEFSVAEWSEVYPHDQVSGAIIDSGGVRHAFQVTVDVPTRRFLLSTNTTGFALGDAQFDVAVTRGLVVTPVPYTKNVVVNVIRGVTTREATP